MAFLETTEQNTIELLQTHYYKASYDQIKEIYLEILKAKKHNVLSINDDYSEIFSESGKLTITAKIIMQTPRETSIDFFIEERSLFGSTKGALKFIAEVLKTIEAKYELKGLGLHA